MTDATSPFPAARTMQDRLLVERLAHRFGASWLGRRMAVGPLAKADRWLLTRSRGRIQVSAGVPLCLLRTTGAKSGQLRIVPVLYTPRGDQVLVVASKAGSQSHPAWYRNMVAHPDLEIDIKGKRYPVRARELHGDEREEAWQFLLDYFEGYATYAQLTERTIPVMALELREGAGR